MPENLDQTNLYTSVRFINTPRERWKQKERWEWGVGGGGWGGENEGDILFLTKVVLV